jgi:hypothetical protein
VARRPRAIGNFLTAMAVHNRGNWIEALQPMGPRRKYPPIVICCMASRFHDRILLSREFPRVQRKAPFLETDRRPSLTIRQFGESAYRKST